MILNTETDDVSDRGMAIMWRIVMGIFLSMGVI